MIAQCTAEIVGSFPTLNARPASLARRMAERNHRSACPHGIGTILIAGRRPFAVNQIVHRSNDRFEHDVEVCGKWRVPIIITSLGARPELNEAVHSWGGITLHDVIDDRFARKAIEKGADGGDRGCSWCGRPRRALGLHLHCCRKSASGSMDR